MIWDKSDGYETIEAEDLMEPGELEIPETCRFIDVTGAIDAADAGNFARALQENLWNNPTGTQLIGVRNNTTIRRGAGEVTEPSTGEDKIPLPERLDKALEGTPMYGLWRELLAEGKETELDYPTKI